MTLRREALHGMLRRECAAADWWNTLTSWEKKAYLKSHPGSKMGMSSGRSRAVPIGALHKKGWRHDFEGPGQDRYRHPDHPDHYVRLDHDRGTWTHTDERDQLLKGGRGASSLLQHLQDFHKD